jgi:hypothetical protein
LRCRFRNAVISFMRAQPVICAGVIFVATHIAFFDIFVAIFLSKTTT